MNQIGETFRPYNAGGNGNGGFSKEFALIVVLFILLIIVGATWCGGFGGTSYGPAYGYGYGPYYC